MAAPASNEENQTNCSSLSCRKTPNVPKEQRSKVDLPIMVARQLTRTILCLMLFSGLQVGAALASGTERSSSFYRDNASSRPKRFVAESDEIRGNPKSITRRQGSQTIMRDLQTNGDDEASLCTLCADEEKTSTPQATVNLSDQTLARDIFSLTTSPLTCEFIETELNQVELTYDICQEILQQTKSVCYCPSDYGSEKDDYSGRITEETLSESQQKTLVWLSRAAAILSGLASLYILLHGGRTVYRGARLQAMLRSGSSRTAIFKASKSNNNSSNVLNGVTTPGYHHWNVSFWIMAILSLVASVGWALASVPIPSTNADAFYGAGGSEAACKLQGFLIQLGIAGAFFTLMCTILAMFEVRRLVDKNNNNGGQRSSTRSVMHHQQQRLTSHVLFLVSLVIGLVLAGVGIMSYSSPGSESDENDDISQTSGGVFWVCYIQGPPIDSSHLEATIFTFAPIWVCVVASAFNVLWMMQVLRKQKEAPEPTETARVETNSTTPSDSGKFKRSEMLVPQRLLSSIRQTSSQKMDPSESEAHDDYRIEEEPDYEDHFGYEQPTPVAGGPAKTGKAMRRGSSVAVSAALMHAAQQHHQKVQQEAAAKEAAAKEAAARKAAQRPRGPPPMQSISVPSQSRIDVEGNQSGKPSGVEESLRRPLGTAHELRRLRLLVLQCAWCVVALLLSLPFLTISQMISETTSDESGDKYFPWWVIVAICTPLHGFWNGVVYVLFAKSWSKLEAQEQSTYTSEGQPATAEQAPHFAERGSYAPPADGDSTASLAPAHEKRNKKKQEHVTKTSAGVFQVVQGHEVKELGVTGDHELMDLSSVTDSYMDDNGNSGFAEDDWRVHDESGDLSNNQAGNTDEPSIEHLSSPVSSQINSGSLPTQGSSILERKGESASVLENSLTDNNTATRS